VIAVSDRKQSIFAFDWGLVYYWMMATTSGWVFGWLLLPAIAPVTAGVGASIVQCLVLVKRIPRAWRWILATAIGFLAGQILAFPVIPADMGVLSGMVIGATAGLAQWVLLRREVHWAGWWIAISSLAWSTSLNLVSGPEPVILPRLVLSGILPSVLTGIALELLLRHPKQKRTQIEA